MILSSIWKKTSAAKRPVFSVCHCICLSGSCRQQHFRCGLRRPLCVYFGSGIGGITTFELEHSKFLSSGRGAYPTVYPMMIPNIAAGNIAIRRRKRSLRLRRNGLRNQQHRHRRSPACHPPRLCDAVFAGGSDAAITPMGVAGFINIRHSPLPTIPTHPPCPLTGAVPVLSWGRCRGACAGRVRTARRRGAKIYAELPDTAPHATPTTSRRPIRAVRTVPGQSATRSGKPAETAAFTSTPTALARPPTTSRRQNSIKPRWARARPKRCQFNQIHDGSHAGRRTGPWRQ